MAPLYLNIACAWLLLLWSSTIGPDAVVPELPALAPLAAPQAAAGAAKPLPHLASERKPRGALPLDPDGALDRQAFLQAFRRQAGEDLLPCLKTWEPPPGAVTVAATLTHSGALLHIASLDPTRPLPDCAASAVSAMAFPALGAHLTRPTVSLQWRIDW